MKKYKICLAANETYGGDLTPTAQSLHGYIRTGQKIISNFEFSWAKFIDAFVQGNNIDIPENSCIGMKINNSKLAVKMIAINFIVAILNSAFTSSDVTKLRATYYKYKDDENDRVAVIEFGPPEHAEKINRYADGVYHYQWSQSCRLENNSDFMWKLYRSMLEKAPSLATCSQKIDSNSIMRYMDMRIRLNQKHKTLYPINISYQAGKIIFSQKYFLYDRVEFVLINYNYLNGPKKDIFYQDVARVENFFFRTITFPEDLCEQPAIKKSRGK